MAAASGKIVLNVRRRLKVIKSGPPLKGVYITDSTMARRGNVNIGRHYPVLLDYIRRTHGDDALANRKYNKEPCYILPSLLGKKPYSNSIAVKYIFGKLLPSTTTAPPLWKQVDAEWYVMEPSSYLPVSAHLSRDLNTGVVLSTWVFGVNAQPLPDINDFYDLKYFVYHCYVYSPEAGRMSRYAT